MGWGFIGDLGSAFDDAVHSIGNSLDNIRQGDFSDAGDYLGQSISDFQPVFDPAGDIGEYVGDIGEMAGFHGEDIFKKVKNNPLRLAFGIDPLGTKIGNKVFNKDWESGTNMWGGPTQQQYIDAERHGIDTSNARGLNQAGQLLASFYAGGPIAQAAGGGALGAAAAGGTFGAMNAIDNGTSIGKGFSKGALGGGLSNAVNFAGLTGVTDPTYQRLINGGIGGGITAGAKGEDIARGAAMGAGGAFLKGQFQSMNQNSMFPEGGMSYAPYNEQADWLGQSMGQSIPSVSAGGMSMQQTTPEWFGSVSPTPMQKPQQNQNFLSQLEQNPWFRGLAGVAGGVDKNVGGMLNNSGMSSSPWEVAGRTLGSLYMQNKARRDAQEQMNRMDVLRGAYRTDMENRLARRDAAGGRRSQYGPREVELMARMAELDSRNAPQLQGLYDARRAANVGALNDVFTGVRRLGGPQQIYNNLASYFGR